MPPETRSSFLDGSHKFSSRENFVRVARLELGIVVQAQREIGGFVEKVLDESFSTWAVLPKLIPRCRRSGYSPMCTTC
jgi:hypothetical protein